MRGHESPRWTHALVCVGIACVWLVVISNAGWAQAKAGAKPRTAAAPTAKPAAAKAAAKPAAATASATKATAPAAEVKCETCHDQVGVAPDGGTRHPAVDMGCDSCHVAHQAGAPADKNNPKHLKKTVPALCADCHEVQQKAAATKSPHTALEGCTDCHDPHSSANVRMLKQAQPALCETCHAEQAEAHQKSKFLHQPAFQAGCTTCHEPHGSDQAAHLRASVNELCLTCHDERARGESGSDAKTLVLFGGAVKLPGNYLEPVRRVALNADHSKGHPTATHPVRTASSVRDTGKPMACTTCHTPHASEASPQLFVTNKRSKSQLCIRCHV